MVTSVFQLFWLFPLHPSPLLFSLHEHYPSFIGNSLIHFIWTHNKFCHFLSGTKTFHCILSLSRNFSSRGKRFLLTFYFFCVGNFLIFVIGFSAFFTVGKLSYNCHWFFLFLLFRGTLLFLSLDFSFYFLWENFLIYIKYAYTRHSPL